MKLKNLLLLAGALALGLAVTGADFYRDTNNTETVQTVDLAPGGTYTSNAVRVFGARLVVWEALAQNAAKCSLATVQYSKDSLTWLASSSAHSATNSNPWAGSATALNSGALGPIVISPDSCDLIPYRYCRLIVVTTYVDSTATALQLRPAVVMPTDRAVPDVFGSR